MDIVATPILPKCVVASRNILVDVIHLREGAVFGVSGRIGSDHVGALRPRRTVPGWSTPFRTVRQVLRYKRDISAMTRGDADVVSRLEE